MMRGSEDSGRKDAAMRWAVIVCETVKDGQSERDLRGEDGAYV
jgi:hypothetical protein